MPAVRGARPIRNKEVLDFHENLINSNLHIPTLVEYADVWKEWINFSDTKSLIGLGMFDNVDYTQGTSQTFDQFILKHCKDREILVLKGDFQYHACLGKHVEFKYVDYPHHLESVIRGPGCHALIISAPFSDFGCIHPDFEHIIQVCNVHEIPVCLDLAYWGISKNVHIDLEPYPCIKEVTCSLSKPFFTLENHRVGIRWTRGYADDGISMLNEVKMANNYSMALGVEYMKNFSPDYNWQKYNEEYKEICHIEDLTWCDTVIFGLGDEERHTEFNRGVKDNYRVCVSEWLGDC
tara:strand:+ start:803 stop:1681 length:879 start_codon:yes stop_codon:yes gene_type:complete